MKNLFRKLIDVLQNFQHNFGKRRMRNKAEFGKQESRILNVLQSL